MRPPCADPPSWAAAGRACPAVGCREFFESVQGDLKLRRGSSALGHENHGELVFTRRASVRLGEYIVKGLILAQNERWRRGLGMQVERIPVAIPGEVAKGAVRRGQLAPGTGIALLTEG